MSERTPYPPYETCPCESGKKYKFCCFTKGFHYYKEPDGEVTKSVPMSKELADALKKHKDYVEGVIGRPLRPHEPLFPNVRGKSLKEKMVEVMEKAQESGAIRPSLVYAFKKTGLLVTEQNKNLISDKDLAEYQAAIDEFYELNPEEDMDAS